VTIFDEITAPYKERFAFTDKEETMRILKEHDVMYYLADIHYMSFWDECCCFWPGGIEDRDNFFYFRYLYSKDDRPERVDIPYLCFENVELLREVLGLIREFNLCKTFSINAKPDFDIDSALTGFETDFEKRKRLIFFYPTEETFDVPDRDDYKLVTADPDGNEASPLYILSDPSITPSFLENSILFKRRVKPVDDFTMFGNGYEDFIRTFYKNGKPIFSCRMSDYEFYGFSMISFADDHFIYTKDVPEDINDMIDFAHKSLCREYRDRGYIVKNIALDEEDPFEGAEACRRIGMKETRYFYKIKDLKNYSGTSI